ncbi:NAD+ synthase [Candidatus Nitrospira nitrificans]|uniref:Glutamine-dependent NAD(+) synthetase n=1 Tax=Candidatus Nitrospira nitrificans TaxID=1742973 RepID=A0A0S4L932_9BACT|nr:NAD+ synthase [Candidatus Nitrospira nitrificans]CUS32326.1 putative glutamine-dependent NAD(+) synthetase [Candidatus Nitrospira nitrificans]
MQTLRIAMAQMNPTVGDLTGNLRRIKSCLREAKKVNADLVVFPELAVTGAPPEDLLLKAQFVAENVRILNEIAQACHGFVAVVGYVRQGDQRDPPFFRPSVRSAGRPPLYNAAALIADRRVVGSYSKWYLPNYGVCDESRYFLPGWRLPMLLVNGTTIGVTICEDMWSPEGPASVYAAAGAEVIVTIDASPFHIGNSNSREQMLATSAREQGVIVAYTNMVGGQDELVFEGNSVILDRSGTVVARGQAFQEELLVADVIVEARSRGRMAHGRKSAWIRKTVSAIDRLVVKRTAINKKKRTRIVPRVAEQSDEIEAVYRALVLAVKDYVRKNGFTRVVLGVSGGVDSAVTAAIAVDAIGAEHVLGIFMPSPYTSGESEEDVVELARCLRIDLQTIPIAPTFDAYRRSLAPSFVDCAEDATEENLQARIRGNLLMALSNKFGHLVLTTGNKSEMSVGYSTLYGDMAGGFAVIKDVPKTMVYGLARFRNALDPSPVIPVRILDRPPTAELRLNQKDEDSLPPYAVLDPILRAYVEDDRSFADIVEAGFDRATVSRVVRMVDSSEFKRRQAPLGVKITHRALGRDRRMPITNGYRIKPK